jgi:hypothetical protein
VGRTSAGCAADRAGGIRDPRGPMPPPSVSRPNSFSKGSVIMFTKGLAALAGLGMLLFAAAGCSKVPADRVDSARAAVQSAQQAEGADYAAEATAAAEKSLADMEEEIRIQNDKFALLRSYKRVNALAAKAESSGTAAADQAREGKSKAREETLAAIQEVKASLQTTRELLAQAVTGKGTEADIQEMKSGLDDVENLLQEVDNDVSTEKYSAARRKVDIAVASLNSIQGALMAAREQQKTPRPRG